MRGAAFFYGKTTLWPNLRVLLLASAGGFLLSCTGLTVGWMIGAMLVAGLLSLWRQVFAWRWWPAQGLKPYWKQFGQWILAVQIGQQMMFSVFRVFQTAWQTIGLLLLLTLLFSVLSGFLLWRFTQANLLTSLYATTPGGITTMPSIADEVGANPVTVSLIQMMRILLVVSVVPMLAAHWQQHGAMPGADLPQAIPLPQNGTPAGVLHQAVLSGSYAWTGVLLLAAWGGYAAFRLLRFPAARLVGGVIGVAVVQVVCSSWLGADIRPWWPGAMKIVAQVLLGASIGANLQRSMFVGMGRTMVVGLLGTLGLVLAMLGVALLAARWVGLPAVTAILAFAPGGVAEMAITALLLKADTSFVVAVQTARLVLIFLLLPPLFRVLNRSRLQKESTEQMDVYDTSSEIGEGDEGVV